MLLNLLQDLKKEGFREGSFLAMTIMSVTLVNVLILSAISREHVSHCHLSARKMLMYNAGLNPHKKL